MITIEDYFDPYNEYKLTIEETYELITTISILEMERTFENKGLDPNNIVFRLLSQVYYFEIELEKNKEVIAYLYYILGYYIGLFLHPYSGDDIAVHYLEKSMTLETDRSKIEEYKTTISMITDYL